jgi:hypothetical protein
MPATALTIEDAPGKWSIVGEVLNFAAADVANGNSIAAGQDLLLVVYNAGGSSRTISITSQPVPPYNRTGDVTALAIAAGEIRVFRLTKHGWADGDNLISLSANHADIKFAVLDLRANA